jgi:hypothetical protein
MSTATDALQARAEILKLARMLERDPAELAYLEPVSLADLCALRDHVIDALFNANSSTLNRLATASKLLPAGLTATISERAFGPLLSARMAGRLEPEAAVSVASKLPIPFLADLAVELDPRRASAVISLIAPAQIAAITGELVRRGEHVTMGRFVGHMGDPAMAAALGAMDNATLLQVAFVLEDKDRLDHMIGLLPDQRLTSLVTAAEQEGLWLEALDLLGHVSAERRRELVATPLELDQAALQAIVNTVVEHELWSEGEMLAEHDAALRDKLASAHGT